MNDFLIGLLATQRLDRPAVARSFEGEVAHWGQRAGLD
jgi:hypothetical protein